MVLQNLVRTQNLGKDFDLGIVEPNTIRVLAEGSGHSWFAAGDTETFLTDLSNTGTGSQTTTAASLLIDSGLEEVTVPAELCRKWSSTLTIETNPTALEVAGRQTTWITAGLFLEVSLGGTVVLPEVRVVEDEWLFDPGANGRRRVPLRLSRTVLLDDLIAGAAAADSTGRVLPGTVMGVRVRTRAENHRDVNVADGYAPNPASRIMNPVVNCTLSIRDGGPHA